MSVEDCVLAEVFVGYSVSDDDVSGLIDCDVGKSGALIFLEMVLMIGEFLIKGKVLVLCSFSRSVAMSFIICCLITCTSAVLEE